MSSPIPSFTPKIVSPVSIFGFAPQVFYGRSDAKPQKSKGKLE
jgi:hypothetical protein